jgi:integrase
MEILMARPRKLPDGLRLRSKTYHADFYAGGRRVRKKLSGNLDAAVEILNDLKAKADKGDFGLLDNDYPIVDLENAYLRYLKQARKPCTLRRYQQSLNVILPALGATNVSQIAVDAVLAFREERLRGGFSPRTINHDTTVLNVMLNWGVRPAKLIASNPLKELKLLSNDAPREGRPLSLEEVDRLLEASHEPWRSIWYALLATGVRFGELQELWFSDLDWESLEIIIRADVAKNHKVRRIPMDDRLHGILSRLLSEKNARQDKATTRSWTHSSRHASPGTMCSSPRRTRHYGIEDSTELSWLVARKRGSRFGRWVRTGARSSMSTCILCAKRSPRA